MAGLRDLDHQLIAALGLSGILMGVVVAFGITGDSLWGELIAWTLTAVLWLWVVRMQRVQRPFLTLLLVSIVAGALFGVTTQLFWSSYLEHNQQTFTQPALEAGQDPSGLEIRATNVALGLLFGGIWGVLVGLAGLAIAKPADPGTG